MTKAATFHNYSKFKEMNPKENCKLIQDMIGKLLFGHMLIEDKILESLYEIEDALVNLVEEVNLNEQIHNFDYNGFGFRKTFFRDEETLSLVRIDNNDPCLFYTLPMRGYTGIVYGDDIYPNMNRKEMYTTMSKEECYLFHAIIDKFMENVINVASRLLSL